MSRRYDVLVAAAWALMIAAGRHVRAADLTVDAPPACVDPATLAQGVGELIGWPLAEIPDVDFRVRITQTSRQRWRLHLETIDAEGAAGAPAVRGSREINGKSCSELAEAASVAIAVSVRSLEAARGEPPAAVKPGSPSSLSVALTDSPVGAIAASLATPSWRPSVTLAVATDTGVLPGTSPGLGVEGDLQRGALRLVLLLTWFTSQDTISARGLGGTFQFAIGGGLACYAPRWGRWTALACGGAELGRLAGTGLEPARPETGAVLWRAVRAEAGATAAVGANTAILLRAGFVTPLARPEFVLDQSQEIYRPRPVAVRLTAGFELGF